ncbi:kinase-like domain-containing protein [Mycena olivaceomarginata]|nr:kinase-like domain-containing protein [Mycena olivaceomarginata]
MRTPSHLFPSCRIGESGVHKWRVGGFGDIFKGLVGGQSVAVKSMRQFKDDDVRVSLKKLGREAVIWRQLSHPNLLPFFGLYVHDNRPSLISPWMDNGDLKNFLNNAPSDINCITLITDVAMGLEYLHRNNVVHGDLKTVNILVTPSGRACIADFGLASIVDELSLKMTFSSRSGRAGTVRYQAPELLMNECSTHFGSDVYAFACVCYEILTGKVPFYEIPNEMAVAIKVTNGARPSKPQVIFPEYLWPLVDDCWRQKADERPTTAVTLQRLRQPIEETINQSPPDWDDSYSAKFRRSIQEWPLLPSIAEIERRIPSNTAGIDDAVSVALETVGETEAPSFDSVRANYLTMLAQKPADTTVAPATAAPGDLFEAIDRITASPEWQSLGDAFPDSGSLGDDEPVMADAATEWLNEPLFGDDSPFLTSPLGDFGISPMETPYSSFLGTPSLRDLDMESPLIAESPPIADESPIITGFGDDFDLFGAASAFPTVEVAPELPPATKLWTFSPSTPALDSIEPASAVKGKSSAPVIPPASTATRRRTNVTGKRRNLTPAALIPLDAPTQKRTYVTPSVTSRKAVPDAIVKERLHSVAFSGDDDDDEVLAELSPTASEAETIEHKRRKNTLAARNSRKRKLEHQQALEGEMQELTKLVTMWRERATMAQELLRGSGVNLSFEDIES